MPAAAVALCALVALGLALLPRREREQPLPPYLATPQETAAFTPDAGVGDSALAEVRGLPSAGIPSYLLGAPMPPKPFPGQRKPPCAPRGEKEIRGGCWVLVGEEQPPCGEQMFDYDGRCWKPSVDMPRQPTSEQP